MKKFICTTLALLLLSLCPMSAKPNKAAADEVDTTKICAVSNHSLSIPMPVLGFEYGYEQKLKGGFSMVFRGGLTGRIAQYNGNFSATFMQMGVSGAFVDDFCFGLTVEPRYYTNLDRRNRLGKTTCKNSGDFVAVKLQASLGKPGTTVDVCLVPEYGIRRVWGKHWFGELTLGAGIAYNTHQGGYLYFKPQAQYRVGFVF